MSQQIQLRRGTAATWTSVNPVLAIGEIGVETDAGRFKIGDGATAWSSLNYAGGGSSAGASGAIQAGNGSGGFADSGLTTATIATHTYITGLGYATTASLGTAAFTASSAYQSANATLAALAAWTPVAIKAHRPTNAQTGTSYTFVLTDEDELVTFSNASAVAASLPLHASVAFDINAEIDHFNLGAGAVTLTPVSGATINGSGSAIVFNQYQGGTLKQLTTNAWIFLGVHA